MSPPIVFGDEMVAASLQRLYELTPSPIIWYMGLFTNAVELTPARTSVDFVEPTWTGYSRLTVPFGGLISAGPGWSLTNLPTVHFFAFPSVLPDTVQGWFMSNRSSGPWSQGFFAHFDSPVVVTVNGQLVPVDVTINLRSMVIQA